ncbi:hypothetical protein NBH00_09580 [Paraconexibacter antarcticus]|uniref:Cellulase (Glycosyl hydrolase family 5) n=1 Tax=Paraconexibacter antarcticus TaxID=2949664 RepID=A0ABY5E025_9ACTN|nr:hypothetical protein [Paraconexibacter antarcticus]UTI66442.1 hypothetical protein NBH00_09580 [Paraconexibacter antarcticus]
MPVAAVLIALLAGLLSAVGGAAGVPAADASTTQESLFQDDNLLLYRGDATADATLRELRGLGVTMVRVTVPWRAFAPAHRARTRPAAFTDATDPAQYDPIVFDLHDHLLRVAARLGMKVLFNVTGGAPAWATGRRDGRFVSLQYKPDARAFRQFVQMLGTRYDGRHRDENQGGAEIPRVSAWSIWNEPNQGAGLQPQWERDRHGRLVPVAPRIYRGLAQAMLSALRATGHGGDTILLGETAPRGVDRRTTTGSLRPVPFLAGLLCLDAATLTPLTGQAARDQACDLRSASRRLAVTGYGHHPYSIVSSPATPDPDARDITLADEARLGRLLDAGAARGLLPPRLPYWWTEYGWQTRPPDPVRGVDPAAQAQWLAEAEAQTRADPRTAALGQFLLVDDLPRDEPGATLERRWGTYQSGLELADRTHKPGYDAYRLPFVLTGTRAWGLVRPVAGGAATATGAGATVQLEHAPAGSDAFTDVGEPVPVAADGTVTTTMGPVEPGRYRFRWSPPEAGAAPAGGLAGLLHPGAGTSAAPTFTSAVATVAPA